jgi:hypothetical protein
MFADSSHRRDPFDRLISVGQFTATVDVERAYSSHVRPDWLEFDKSLQVVGTLHISNECASTTVTLTKLISFVSELNTGLPGLILFSSDTRS